MARSHSRWTPTPDIRSHIGGRIPTFAPPPAEIGPVRSAQCSLRTGGVAVVSPIARKVAGIFMFFGKMEGGYFGSQKDPDLDAALHFAVAAEEAWTQYILPQMKAELERTGSVPFIAARGTVGTLYAVGRRGSLEVIAGKKKFVAPARDLEDIFVFQGYIIITRKDAKLRAIPSFDGSGGVYDLSYGAFLSVKAFFSLLTPLVGVTCRHSD